MEDKTVPAAVGQPEQLTDSIIRRSILLTKNRGLSLMVYTVTFIFVLILYGFIKYALGVNMTGVSLLPVAWLLGVFLFQLSSRSTTIIGIIFLLSLPFLPTAGDDNLAVTLASNAFFFLLLGTFQQMSALLKGRRANDRGDDNDYDF